ncbi:peptidoglycan DD-metalloendopeptidase family protein [Streptomyces tubercidicus]|uniref:M23 family metallopeptidase n=1 Tax=Streptomyces tubercidicus TaxID=47759 RepID=UPI002E14D200|nr:M23 family metallopeptidase [Streptomyces tubercidicus]WSX21405.1 M23 family metallopeptidase [Streptomyces tubercidicus]
MKSTTVRKLCRIAARACLLLFLALVGASFFVDIPYWWGWVPLGLWIAIGFGVNRRAARAEGGGVTDPVHEPVAVAAPVTGRWKALNSPADKVPSHGTRSYGQAYAIDIVAEPEPNSRPAFGWWPLVRRNEDFPAFGAPLLAVADATVVHAEDGQRDHLSRTSWPAAVYLLALEGPARTLGSGRRLIGNHVVLDLGDGVYALYAHVRRGSLTVRTGDRVRTGETVGQCGDSGNSSEPHVHFQLMDAADPVVAHGLPFTWQGIGVPRNGETFEAGKPLTTPAG